MTERRLWQSIMLVCLPGSARRTNYLKRQGVFAQIGDNVSIMSRKVPLYANLIRIGNNVHIASNVTFLTHDITHAMLNGMKSVRNNMPARERIGCIEIADNVFIGAGTQIMYDVKINSGVIIAAGSVVTKDIPPNCVVGGVPAKYICSLDQYIEKRKGLQWYPENMKPSRQVIDDEFARWMWQDFHSRHNRMVE